MRPKSSCVEERLVAGRYQLDRILGEGASGRVYLARDTKERGSVWAVKELDYSSLPPDEVAECRELFAREAELLKGLRHPSLPLVVEYFCVGLRDYDGNTRNLCVDVQMLLCQPQLLSQPWRWVILILVKM